jgi:hypothetical protein
VAAACALVSRGRRNIERAMAFSDLPSPAEAGFAKAGNRLPLFRIML